MNDLQHWLDQVREDILEPDLAIIDTHHHLWNHDDTPYLLDNLWADTGSGHNVTQTVFIECGSEYYENGPQHMKPVGETEFVARIAKASVTGQGATIAAIVGHADLLLGTRIEEVLNAHVEAGDGLFRGIRHSAAYDPSDAIRPSHSSPPADLYERTEVRAALKVLGAMGLSCDAWHYHPYMNRFADLARAVPDTSFILDHFGGPIGLGPYAGKQDEIFEVWKDDLRALAACDNVMIKLGGLAMPVNGWDWHNRAAPATSDELAALHGRYYAHAIDVFGPDRAMFESNFPVDRRSISYPVLWNGFKKIAAGFSGSDKAALFSETARRAYRIA
jgi:predicted TIM-barrel fold metal-dependent hydrolase